MSKKYKLHCFGCGSLFYNKKDVCRIEGMPFCGECEGNYYQNKAAMEVYDYELEKWRENHPNMDYEQYQIDQANINKYGEC